MSASSLPPIAQAFQLAAGFAFTQSVHAFVQLGIPELLKDETRSTDAIAAQCGAHPETLFRFLRLLAQSGVVELDGRQCRLTAAGRFFRKDLPGNITQDLELMTYEPWQEAWNNLLYSLRTGEAAFHHAMGEEPWEYFRQHPEYGRPFNEWMTALSQMNAQALVDNYDFSPATTICDVGGGHGFLLKTLLSHYPQARGILFDLPYVVAGADLEGVADRCATVGGDFFENVPRADILILKSILHDWNDEKAVNILRNCAAALEPGGKILAMDMVITDDYNPVGYFYDMHMQVMLGGRERTQEEFSALFARADLVITRFIATGSPQCILEAEKA
ncbi:MAG: hypothetical protein IPM81_13045 [Saprospirales bacterium]|nr:hypothetical protein [Saprospirales bacterium]